MLQIFVDLLRSIVRFLLSRANLNSVEWQSRQKSHECSSQRDLSPVALQQARGEDSRSAFLCIFTAFFPGLWRLESLYAFGVALGCFRTREKDSALATAVISEVLVSVAACSDQSDSCWVLPSPSSPEAVGLGDVACHFSLLPLQGRDCLTLVVYTAPSTMSALHIN